MIPVVVKATAVTAQFNEVNGASGINNHA